MTKVQAAEREVCQQAASSKIETVREADSEGL